MAYCFRRRHCCRRCRCRQLRHGRRYRRLLVLKCFFIRGRDGPGGDNNH